MRSPPKLLSLMLIILVWGCSSALQSTSLKRHEDRSFSLVVSSEQKQKITPIGKALREAIKDKLIQKGYIYKETTEYADLKGVIQHKTILEKNQYLQLDVRLDIYDTLSSQKIWSIPVSNTVQYQDIIADLIQPIARQLTLRFPYAARLGGIGVAIGRDLRIKDFSSNSPAKEGGLQLNDMILKVDNKGVTELSKCKNMLKGEVNTPVRLTVKRGSRELHFRVNRISLNQMVKEAIFIDEASRKNLERDFRREILQQP